MSNFEKIEELINDQYEQKPDKEQTSVHDEESEHHDPAPVPPPSVPDDEVSKAKDQLYGERINHLKEVINGKDEEINSLKQSIKEINKQHQLERESFLTQSKEKVEEKKEDGKKLSELSSKKLRCQR